MDHLEGEHSNIWWSDALELIDNIFTYAIAHELYRKGIQCANNIWDTKHCTFLS